jgi:His-Xaa-Ser system protein HxsD
VSLIAWSTDKAHHAVPIDLSIYSVPAVIRAAYKLTDRAFVYLQRDDDALETKLWVFLFGRSATTDVGPLILELMNELVDQQLRVQLEAEFKDVRTLIVAQAFAEGNLLDPNDERIDYRADPREAGKRR